MKLVSLKFLSILIVISVFASSCVSMKKYNELQEKRMISETENQKLKKENMKLEGENDEYSSLISKFEKEQEILIADTTVKGEKLRSMRYDYRKLNKNYENLLQQNKDLINGNALETKKILTQLQSAQSDLIKREDSLAALETEFNNRKKKLDILEEELAEIRNNLKLKEKAYNDLNDELRRKDSIMKALRTSVAEALVGFENDGLTVSNKEGRVYVSMDNKLMFASGSFKLNPKGESALLKLGNVLSNSNDITILVEGHTDSVPYNGSGNLVDNWDLSAKRATSIVRILIKNSNLDPSKITAAGRGEFSPVDSNSTSEGRAKNRRTEIILMPDISRIYEIVK